MSWVGPDGVTYQDESFGKAYMANFGQNGTYGTPSAAGPYGGGFMGGQPGQPGAGGGGQFNWQAQVDPYQKQTFNMMKGRYGEQYSVDPLLTQRMSTDTTNRAIGRATSKIGDQALGQMARANALRAKGMGGGPSERSIGEDSARRKAGASADISLGRERDLDALASLASNQRMTWEQGRNGILSAMGGQSGAMAANQLGQATLGANVWNMGQTQQLNALSTMWPMANSMSPGTTPAGWSAGAPTPTNTPRRGSSMFGSGRNTASSGGWF